MTQAIAAPFRPIHFAIVGVVVTVNVLWITLLALALADGVPAIQGLVIGAALFIEYRLARYVLDRERPVVIVDGEGIYDRRCMLAPVPWREIQGLWIHEERRRYVRAFLILEGVDPDRHLGPRWRRVERRILRVLSGRPIMSVSLSDLGLTPHKVGEAARLWFEADLASRQPPANPPAA